jgi:hypothetical protein
MSRMTSTSFGNVSRSLDATPVRFGSCDTIIVTATPAR